MSATEEVRKKRGGRKLAKRPRSIHRLPSTHVPDRLRYGDDANEDVTSPTRAGSSAPQYMHQSIFSMIAAAGSRADFNARFDESSDSEVEDELTKKVPVSEESSDQPQTLKKQPAPSPSPTRKLLKKEKGHKSKSSEHGLLKALPKLSLHTRHKSRDRREKENVNIGGEPEPAESSRRPHPRDHPRDAPMMSRLLEAEAELTDADGDAESGLTSQKRKTQQSKDGSAPATLLATRLMEIFGLDEPEEVISEYPCWLLQTVLLQGYLYITQKHICFYAYLPKKSAAVVKSGYLSKKGRQNRKYSRYWFTLKGDVLSYYPNSVDLFFPAGNIDLRYGISATLGEDKGAENTTKHLSLTTNQRTYHFHADSHASAKEWVKNLQKVIFRSHNDGDSVKISLPVENVIDVEESPVVDFAETIKVRVLESADSFAIDEYFFSFFSFGRDALNLLNSMIDDSALDFFAGHGSPEGKSTSASPAAGLSVDGRSPRGRSTTPMRESIKATYLPPPSPASGTASPRQSLDLRRSSRERKRLSLDSPHLEYGRASFDRGRRADRPKPSAHESVTSLPSQTQDGTDSFVQSFQDAETSPAAQSPALTTQDSASQILNRSDVFLSPTINRYDQSSTPHRQGRFKDLENVLRSASMTAERRSSPSKVVREGHRPRPSLDTDAYQSHAATTGHLRRNTSSPNLQDIVKAGSFPLQRAAGFAGYLKNSSARMSKMLATESMGYLEKVSGMWAGSRRHYGENEGIVSEDQLVDPEDEESGETYGDRFRAHFALPAAEKLRATYFAYLHRVLPLYGKIYISNRHFCFRSLLPGTRTRLILPLKEIENVEKEKGFRFGYHGLVLVIRGHEEIFFEFRSFEHRDDCTVTLLKSLETIKTLEESGVLAQENQDLARIAKEEHDLLQAARSQGKTVTEERSTLTDSPPIIFDDARASIINLTPTKPMKITCLTIGSRGDVQPYIALCKGLMAEGHQARIATHAEFEDSIRKHGIDFKPVSGDPAELMRICVENGMFTYSFLKEATFGFRDWIEELLHSAWEACQGSEILIESPSAMAGIHIAEALRIPYFRAFTMPWTRTRAYPHAFAVPEHRMGGAYNFFSYVMFDNMFWKFTAIQINRWRRRELGLLSTNLDKLQTNKVPFLYNFSPHVVVPPLDYSDWVRVTGYWFLDESVDWTPPKELVAFIAKARADKKKLVYVGFGSIVVSDPIALTKTVVEAVVKADVRCILSKGWSDRLETKGTAAVVEVPLPPEIHHINSAPHDWLFRQIDAAAHHGGSGTTGASLRAGLPTIIKPFFGDQYFYGSRVEDLGVGISLKKVNVSVFSRALWEATHSERMITKARVLGEQIRKETGVQNAIQAIYRDLEYAKTLVKARHKHTAQAGQSSKGTSPDGDLNDDLATEIEESWTFIGDESDPELHRRVREWDPAMAKVEGAGVRASIGAGIRPRPKSLVTKGMS